MSQPHHSRELQREIKQRERARVSGELVLPPRSLLEQEADEAINEAEIDALEARRTRLYRTLSDPGVPQGERAGLSFDLDSASRSLTLAYASKRRLAVARSLLGSRTVLQ